MRWLSGNEHDALDQYHIDHCRLDHL